MNIRHINDLDAFHIIDRMANISQTPEEIIWFLDQVRKYTAPRVIVEVGCWTGGNLALMSRLLPEDGGGLVIGINPRVHHDMDWIREGLVSAAAAPNEFIFLDGRSDDPAVYTRLVDILGGRGIDVLFMDYTDQYDEAKAGYDTYIGLMNSPGIIGWHDISDYPDACGRVWMEASADHRSDSLILSDGRGIGIVIT